MNRKYVNIALMFCAVVLFGCSATKQSAYQDGHNSQNSLDWNGYYAGVLPCADCEGIDTRIQLQRDNTYQLSQKYLGREGPTKRSTGQFAWINNGSDIVLKDESMTMHFKVGENRLILLDGSGKQIMGDLKEDYILHKEINAITEKYWKLLELNGKKVTVDGAHEPFIILKQDSTLFKGNGGCNTINGDYMLGAGNVIHFNNIVSTDMACKSLDSEAAFLKSLIRVDHFSLNGDNLSFDEGGKTIAKFEAVYL